MKNLALMFSAVLMLVTFTGCGDSSSGGGGGGNSEALAGEAVIFIDPSGDTYQIGVPNIGESLICGFSQSYNHILVASWQYGPTPNGAWTDYVDTTGSSPLVPGVSSAQLYLGVDTDYLAGQYVRCIVEDPRSDNYPDKKTGKVYSGAFGPITD